MDTQTILVCLLSSTVASAIIASLKELILWKLNRKAKQEDEKEETNTDIQEMRGELQTLKESVDAMNKKIDVAIKSDKVLLQNAIIEKAIKHINREKISYEDRKLLHEMWDIYHYGCNGNGDLDMLMSTVDELELEIA